MTPVLKCILFVSLVQRNRFWVIMIVVYVNSANMRSKAGRNVWFMYVSEPVMFEPGTGRAEQGHQMHFASRFRKSKSHPA